MIRNIALSILLTGIVNTANAVETCSLNKQETTDFLSVLDQLNKIPFEPYSQALQASIDLLAKKKLDVNPMLAMEMAKGLINKPHTLKNGVYIRDGKQTAANIQNILKRNLYESNSFTRYNDHTLYDNNQANIGLDKKSGKLRYFGPSVVSVFSRINWSAQTAFKDFYFIFPCGLNVIKRTQLELSYSSVLTSEERYELYTQYINSRFEYLFKYFNKK